MKLCSMLMTVVLAAAAIAPPTGSDAGGLGRALERGGIRSLGRSVGRGAERGALRPRPRAFLRQERLRDLRTKSRVLDRPRTVYRYVPAPRARVELHRGIPAGKHMTSRRAIGRPLGGSRARQVYGLPKKPGAVETVRIPDKQPVRFNKVMGGARGRGEITSPKGLPPTAVRATHLVK